MDHILEDDFLLASKKMTELPLDIKTDVKLDSLPKENVHEADLLSLDSSKLSPSESESLSSEISVEPVKKDSSDFKFDPLSSHTDGSVNDLADFLKAESQTLNAFTSVPESHPPPTDFDTFAEGIKSHESDFSAAHLESSDDDHLFQPMNPTKSEASAESGLKSRPLSEQDLKDLLGESKNAFNATPEPDLFDADKPVPPVPADADFDDDNDNDNDASPLEPTKPFDFEPVRPVEIKAPKQEDPVLPVKSEIEKPVNFGDACVKPKSESSKSSPQDTPVETKSGKSAFSGGDVGDLTIGPQDFFSKIGLDAWFHPEQLHPKVEALIYWRDPKKSGVVFGVSLIILIALSIYSLISVIANLSLIVLAGTIVFRVYKSVLQAVQKTSDGHPFKEYLEYDLNLPQEKLNELTNTAVVHLNAGLSKVRKLFLVEDLVDSIKFGVGLWTLTYIGAWFNGLTLIILGLIALFTLPKVYENNKAQIDQNLGVVKAKISEITSKLTAALPVGKKDSKDKEQ